MSVFKDTLKPRSRSRKPLNCRRRGSEIHMIAAAVSEVRSFKHAESSAHFTCALHAGAHKHTVNLGGQSQHFEITCTVELEDLTALV